MDWTEKDLEELRKFRNVIDNDNTKIKEQIKQKLIENKYIIHALNNKELEEADAEPDDYFGINILPMFMINPTQTNVQNFICFETQYDEVERYNNRFKMQQIIFYVLCHKNNIIDRETSLARHDLLAALITEQFNWTNIFGQKIHLISDRPTTTDTDYATRTLVFQQISENAVVKTKNGITRLANKDIVQ